MLITGFVVSLLLVFCHAQSNHQQRWIQELLEKKRNPSAVMHNNNKQWAQDSFPHQPQQSKSDQYRLAHSQQGNLNHYGDRWTQEVQHVPDVRSKRLSKLSDRICWEDGLSCEADSTCVNCCNGTSTSFLFGTQCGVGSCLANGTVCTGSDYNEWLCYQCCYDPYGGNTCGGVCSESGTICDLETTCNTCCNYTFYQTGDDEYQCGCKEDGMDCIPGQDCYSCCNGAYDNDGLTCGGTCIADDTQCTYGVDCHLCCSYYTHWYSTGTTHCGQEKCYEDGTSCIPGVSCSNCCSGGAFEGDGTVCGGECIPLGSNCNYLTSCNQCCNPFPTYFPFDDDTSDSSLAPSMSPSSNFEMPGTIYYNGQNFYWNYTTNSMVCGGESCWANGTSCDPQSTCYKCCYGAFDTGGKCGGECLPSGSLCSYYSTCNSCCEYNYQYNATLKSYVCSTYEFDHANSTSEIPY